MSYTAEVVNDKEVEYGCSNMCWHIMVNDILKKCGIQYRTLLYKIDYPHRVRWYDCREIASLIRRVTADDCTFASEEDLKQLHRVFDTAAEMKSSVEIW